MNTLTSRLQFKKRNGILTFSLPATKGWSGEQWIDYFRSKGIRMERSSEKIILEALTPTIGTITNVVIVTGETVKDEEAYDVESMGRMAHAKNFRKLTLENACQLRDILSQEEFEHMEIKGISILFEDIPTHGPEYLVTGVPQCIMIGSHELHGNYFYCIPYGKRDKLGKKNGVAYIAPEEKQQ